MLFQQSQVVSINCRMASVVTVAGICNSVGGGVFLDMPPRCRCWLQWRISVGVKARVVNLKQVKLVDCSRLPDPERSGCPGMR